MSEEDRITGDHLRRVVEHWRGLIQEAERGLEEIERSFEDGRAIERQRAEAIMRQKDEVILSADRLDSSSPCLQSSNTATRLDQPVEVLKTRRELNTSQEEQVGLQETSELAIEDDDSEDPFISSFGQFLVEIGQAVETAMEEFEIEDEGTRANSRGIEDFLSIFRRNFGRSSRQALLESGKFLCRYIFSSVSYVIRGFIGFGEKSKTTTVRTRQDHFRSI